jgi:hypothetical protein
MTVYRISDFDDLSSIEDDEKNFLIFEVEYVSDPKYDVSEELNEEILDLFITKLGEFKKIKIGIYLINTKLKMIPESISKLTNLKELVLRKNFIETIPEFIFKLNLTKLDLRENEINITYIKNFDVKLYPNIEILL